MSKYGETLKKLGVPCTLDLQFLHNILCSKPFMKILFIYGFE